MTPGSRRATAVAIIALAAVAAVVFTATAVSPSEPGGQPTGGSSATLPAPTAIPSSAQSPTPSPTRPVVDVPASIDPTGRTVVTSQLQAVIDAAPDGSLIRFGERASYLIDSGLVLEGRTGLEIDGRGATVTLGASDKSRRRNLWLVGSNEISIHDLHLVGSNPAPGVLDEARQFEHGIWVDSGSDISIRAVSIENPWGDCVYLGDRDGRMPWVDGLDLTGGSCRGAGRNGVSIVAGRNVRIEDNTFGTIGLHAVDLEPNQGDTVQGADGVSVTNNRVDGAIEYYFVAANGWGPIANLSITGNVLLGAPLRITVKPVEGSGYLRKAIRVVDNTSDTVFDGEGASPLEFRDVVGLTVTGNTAPIVRSAPMIRVQNSCQVEISGNTYPGGSTEWRGSVGLCPVERAG